MMNKLLVMGRQARMTRLAALAVASVALVALLAKAPPVLAAPGLDLAWLSHPLRQADPALIERVGAEFEALQRDGRLALLTELTDRPSPAVRLDPARLLAAIDSPLLLLRLAAAGRPDLSRELVDRILAQGEPPVLRQLVTNPSVALTDGDRLRLRAVGDPAIVQWLDQEQARSRARPKPPQP